MSAPSRGVAAGGLVFLAAIVVVAAGSPARPRTDSDVAVEAAARWSPPTRAVERARADALAALFRARGRGSVEGVLQACETFATIGDREVVTACVRIARGLVGADRVDARLRALEHPDHRRDDDRAPPAARR